MTTSWREVRAVRPPDVDRSRGFRIKADILREIELAREARQRSESRRRRWPNLDGRYMESVRLHVAKLERRLDELERAARAS